MAQYLDLTGLSKYDELIKALINKADTDLGKRIDAVVEDCGENNSSLTEIVALIGNIEDGKTDPSTVKFSVLVWGQCYLWLPVIGQGESY
jgi:hypothetical protein